MTEDYCLWDSAYVLGSLPPAERREYEAHLATCETCQRSIRDFAGLPGLLAKIGPADFESPALPPPPTLLPALVQQVHRERARRRRLTVLVASAAAVLAIATFGVVHALPHSSSTPVAGIAMSRVANTPIHARVALTPKSWGTQINLVCSYDKTLAYGRKVGTYTLFVISRAGTAQPIASWKVVPSGESKVTGSVGWSRTDIKQVEIRNAQGSPVLRLQI